jgi:hypothetical protein
MRSLSPCADGDVAFGLVLLLLAIGMVQAEVDAGNQLPTASGAGNDALSRSSWLVLDPAPCRSEP